MSKANYAADKSIMQTGQSVKAWRDKVKETLEKYNFDGDHPNKYSPYVYDAVWLYALSLDRLVNLNKSYIHSLHTDRTIRKYVDIISSMDFYGVSGRINFPNHGHSRLSNIKVNYFCIA